MSELAGRVALVTGGAGGVGRAVVELLARRGAVVYLNCFHSYPEGRAIAERLTADGLDVRVVRGSVAKAEHVTAVVDEIRRSSGRLDILVNNAALGVFGTAQDLTEDDLDRTFAVNLKAPLRCVREARSLLAASDAGAVVNVSSIGATAVLRDYLAIGVSKAALESMTRYLAVELAPEGIRVNTASGGLLDTPGGRMFPDFAALSSAMSAQSPLRRIGRVDELAEVVAFLASPRASWLTGQTVTADGGIGLVRGSHPATELAATEPAVAEPTVAEVVVTEPTITEPAVTELVDDPVVVVGMGLAVPGASSPEEFWDVLSRGPMLFSEAKPDRWVTAAFTPGRDDVPDKGYQPACGLITDFHPHPALAAEGEDRLAAMDFGTLWLRHSLYQALARTSHTTGDRFSFCVGLTADGSQHLSEIQVTAAVREMLHGPAGHHLRPAEKTDIERRLANRFPYGAGSAAHSLPHAVATDAIDGILPEGTAVHVVDTACSSSLYALERGVRELRAGQCDVAVCGGAAVMQITNMVAFAKLGGLSRTGQVRSLDEDADGVLFADGAALVVLKRLSRARRDGDTVLGVIRGVGLSADGKGKAINAPATRGQITAARRALAKSGVDASAIDLVIAHATGTPTGDSAELLGIHEVYAMDRPVTVVSNKSVVGHTGWPAGVVSLIHAMLCLQHDRVPPQHRFTRLPAHVTEQAPMVIVPREPVDWPRTDRPRTAAVAAFGFGGTNATAIVAEHLPGWEPPRIPCPTTEPLAIVGYAAREPAGGADTFGRVYPVPSFAEVSLPPPMMRRIDRGQLLAIECTQQLPESVRDFCQLHREDVGVLLGIMGQTGAMTGAQLRVHFDDVRECLDVPDLPGVRRFLANLRGELVQHWPEISADTMPGMMPNVIASRIANYFDLRGLNLVVDASEASLLEAFETAAGYLDTGDLRLALVGGMSANPHPGWAAAVRPALALDGDLTEGAYLFAVTRESTARAAELPILAVIER